MANRKRAVEEEEEEEEEEEGEGEAKGPQPRAEGKRAGGLRVWKQSGARKNGCGAESSRKSRNLTYPGLSDKEETDPETPEKCPVRRESVYRDRHFLVEESEGKKKSPKWERNDSGATKERTENDSRPVHKAIELFDRPNDIETSLPRYQNKVSKASKSRSLEDDRRKTRSIDMDKLREQLQAKLASRLEKCKSDNLHLGKAKTEDRREKEEKDRKSEKEKRNSLLKVNLDQMRKSDPLESLEPGLMKEKKVKYLKKEEKGSEYGGGWDCHRCGRRVYHAERMLACGDAYHKNCFSCVACKKLLGPRTYLEAEMEIYCSHCHAKKFGLTMYGFGLGPGVLQTSP